MFANSERRFANAFLGREHEMALLRSTLRANRLTSLVGPGGVGKTRLARELAKRSTKDIKIVELAALMDPHALLDFVAARLGVRERPGETALSAVISLIEQQRFVLLFDNCEHLVEQCSELVGQLLRRCPKLHVVVTSREPLSVPGEVVVRIGPLSVDVAARLFADRAGLGQRVSAEDTAAISRICRNVEGLPLAVELAARRARATCVREVADGLSDLLHHDLRATIQWSYRLLTEVERSVLRSLSLLVDGFSLDAATAICPVPNDRVLPTMLRLAAKSLIERTASPDGSIRFRMQESIRVFARDQLRNAGEEAATWTRTLDWLVGLTPPLREDVFLPSSYRYKLDAEQDNLFAAVRWMASTGRRPHDRVLLTAALARSWQFCGRVSASLRLLEQVVADVPASPHLAVVLQPISWGYSALGDTAKAMDAAVAAVRVARGCGHLALEIRALNQLGCVLVGAERYATAEALYRHALGMARGLPPTATALLRNNHAWMLTCSGDEERAASLLAKALPVYREHVADQDLSTVLHTAATVDIALGDYAAARERLVETLRVAPDNSAIMPQLIEGLGVIAEKQDDPMRALVLFAAASAYRTRMQRVVGGGWGRRVAASVSAAVGRLSRKDCLAAQRRGRRMTGDVLRDYLAAVSDADDTALTTRELQVVRCVAYGDGNQEIARQLGMAARTVSSHLERVKEKLGLYDRSSIQQWYLVQHG